MMNNLNNISGNNFNNNLRSFEISEAKKRMNLSSMGISNNLSSQASMISQGSSPSLNNSISVDSSELQQAKQNMNQFSSSMPLNNRMS